MTEFQTTSLMNVLFGNVNNGTPGCFGIRRESDFDNHLALHTQRRRAPITNLAVSLQARTGQRFVFDQHSLPGVILLDVYGEKENPVRILLCAADGTPLLSSDCDIFRGQIIILANIAVGGDPKLFGVKAVFEDAEFDEEDEEPHSTAIWDGSKQLTKLWRTELHLMAREGHGIDSQLVHL